MTRFMLNATVVLALAVVVSACGNTEVIPTGPTPNPEPTSVILTGIVRSNGGSPLNGATVKIMDGVNAGKSVATVNGAYRFDGLTVGNANVSASADGYQESRIRVEINGLNTTLDFTLEPLPPVLVSLTGMVRSKAGSALSGATVRILDGVNAGKSVATVNGAYRFDGLAVGNANLSAGATGYLEARAGVYVDGSNTLDFVLEPAPPTLVSLTGMVRSNGGSPLNGVTVRILDGVNAGRTTTTGTSGAYRFEGLTVGNANLSAKAVGYAEVRAGVYINGSNTLDFVLNPEVIDPNGSWVGSGTGTASDGTPVSVTIELEVSAREVETWVVRYKIGGCQSTFTDRQNIPILGNSFERNLSQNRAFLYTPTVFKGKFVSATEVSGVITLVSSSGGCPASATVNWSGTRR